MGDSSRNDVVIRSVGGRKAACIMEALLKEYIRLAIVVINMTFVALKMLKKINPSDHYIFRFCVLYRSRGCDVIG